jgi:hypothetical protein
MFATIQMNMDYVLNCSSYSQSQREGGGESTYIGGGPALDQHNTHGDVKNLINSTI